MWCGIERQSTIDALDEVSHRHDPAAFSKVTSSMAACSVCQASDWSVGLFLKTQNNTAGQKEASLGLCVLRVASLPELPFAGTENQGFVSFGVPCADD